MINIDEKKCKRDGICIAECPAQIITVNGTDSLPVPVEGAIKRCIKCGHCVAVCPYGALTHTSLKTEDFVPVEKKFDLTFEQAQYFLRSRRSIRTYLQKPVEDEKLSKLVDAARYAPTAKNTQMVRWIIINSRDKVAALTAMAIDSFREMVKAQHPVAVQYRLDGVVAEWDKGFDRICRGAPALVVVNAPKEYTIASVDCTSALAYLDLAAPSIGLATCWAGCELVNVSQ